METLSIKEEEQNERRHADCVYSKLPGTWVLKPYDWEKFNEAFQIYNGYVYSIKALGDINNKKILDFGCGSGWQSVILSKLGGVVTGIDISTEAIRVACRMAEINDVSSSTEFKACSGYDTGLSSEEFDFIIGQAILHHMSDKELLAKELRRLLKPGGKAIFHECFGESIGMEKLRTVIPVAINDSNKENWNKQLKYRDIEVLSNFFDVTYKEFQLLSRIDRVSKNQSLLKLVNRLDSILLSKIKFLRRYARTIVVIMTKPAPSNS